MAVNANELHEEKLSAQDRIALLLTNSIGTMFCVYLFTILGGLSLYGALTNNTTLVLVFGSISSYFIQLVLLPLIMVGQGVQSRHTEIRADLEFETTQREELENQEILLRLERMEQTILDLMQKTTKTP
jgi:NhaP-type Na+/H+ or K+/H+ antiporter